jgi:type II secretory ATPase GspE/PulE/Tfp pilus assembly ATPase PilB-like protein
MPRHDAGTERRAVSPAPTFMNPALVSASPLQALKMAVTQAYPERPDVAGLKFDGSLAQAWQAFARLVGADPATLARSLAPIYGVPVAGAIDRTDSTALALLPSGFCQQNNILPQRLEDGRLVVATANPFDENVTEKARFIANKSIQWVLAPPQEIEDAIVVAYSKEAAKQAGDATQLAQAALDENAIVKLGKALLGTAIAQRASDLHIQPFLGAFVVRLRVDGVLKRLNMLPDAVAVSLIRHFKARSGMEPTNMIVPQDGRMSTVHEGREFDMRVSTLPATRGERLVIRFLDQSSVHRLSQSNFSHAALQTLKRSIARPAGMVIMTGPTGSGKTSTLYGMLGELNRSTANIITVENPVEYRIPGISQVEVNEKAGRSFQAALRSILRQDPDVLLIGEIRDHETAEIACQAALTGHLVLSTLHTNDALTAIPRLLNLGVQPSILADSLAVVVAQRLCRKLCPACRQPAADPLSPEERTFLEVTHNRPGYRAVGCKSCDYTGYRGRLPIVDIIEMTKGLRDAVALGESRLAELDKLREGGLKSLAASGSLRVISGDTTVAEVMEAVGPSFWPELADHYGTVCFADALELNPHHVNAGQTVLLIGDDAALADKLAPLLEAEGLLLSHVRSAEEAHIALEKNEEIAFIIGDIPEGEALPQAIERLRANRLHISWARLPALVLLPGNLADQEPALRESGVMAAFLRKPWDEQDILKCIWQSRAR